MCIIVTDESHVGAFANFVSSETSVKEIATEKPVPATIKIDTSAAISLKSQQISSPSQISQVSSPPSGSIAQTFGTAGRIFASPLAKTLAREKGIDLSGIVGSGPNNRIRAQDVLNAPTSGLPAMSPTASFEQIEVTNMRKVIAKRLSLSKQTVPHYYLTAEIEVDELLRFIFKN